MRRQLQRAALLGAMFAASGVMARPAIQNFMLSNETGVTIAKAYVSPTLAEDWGSDVLGRGVMRDGEYSPIVFSPRNDLCVYDIRVESIAGDALMWTGINLCSVSVVTLFYNSNSGEVLADTR
jgi:hypothetical protein